MDLVGFLGAEGPAFRLAVQFLTRLPLAAPFSEEAMRRSPRWYPGVGALVGVVAALAHLAGFWLFSPDMAILLALAAAILVTGALHEDGFADACDGLGGQRPKERVLEIMRDSRIGTYGVLALVLIVSARFLALRSLPVEAVGLALVGGHAASRASMLWIMASSDYARESGAGSAMAGAIDRQALGLALASTVLALAPLVLVLPLATVITGLAGLVLGHVLMRRWYEPRLGGYTGDCLGAVQQCSEIGFYLGLLLPLSS